MRLKLDGDSFVPKSIQSLRTYRPDTFVSDLVAGVTVGLVALPLALASAIASGVPPQAGIYRAAPVAAADTTRSASGVRYVYLVRHGMYDRGPGADDRFGNGLNPLGHEQAKLAGARLGALPVRMNLLVSSDFTRARQTADDIGAILQMFPSRDSLLRECTPSSDRPGLEGSAADFASCDSTLAAAFAKYLRPSADADRHEVLVCHGNVIRWMVSRALGLDPRRWHLMDIANASLTILAVRPDGTIRLVMYSDVGHLPVEKQTWAGKGAGWARPGTR